MDVKWPAMRVSCDQDIAGDGFFSLGMVAEFDASLASYGSSFYRHLFWETGFVGQVLYLEAEAAAGRAVAWVSAEGVGVAPTIPTLGDRRASGHSIIGLAVFDRSALRAEAIGRCWSQGRLLAWLADS